MVPIISYLSIEDILEIIDYYFAHVQKLVVVVGLVDWLVICFTTTTITTGYEVNRLIPSNPLQVIIAIYLGFSTMYDGRVRKYMLF
jgi:hypothetical protein